jgi:hypothetical protein
MYALSKMVHHSFVMRTSSIITCWQRRNMDRNLVVVGGDRASFIILSCLSWEEEATLIGRVNLPLLD